MAGHDTIVLNEFVDRVLVMTRDGISQSGESTVPLPDLDENFDTGGFLKIAGTFRTSGGKFGDLSTLRRTGDVVMETREDKLTVKARLGLGSAFVRADAFRLSLGRIRLHGSLDVKVGRNSASTMIVAARDPGTGTYNTELEYARVDDLDDFDVKITGLGVFSAVTGRIATWLVGMIKNDIKNRINEILEGAIRDVLRDFDVNDTIRLLVGCQLCPPLEPTAIAQTIGAFRSIYNTIFD